jgi:hypothetical protein
MPRLRLVWIDVLQSAPFLFRNAAGEASAILADAGVETTWTLGESSAGTTGDELRVVLLAGAANGARLPDRVMGGTRRGAQSHTTWIYLSNVLWALDIEGGSARRLTPLEEALVARALGRVVVHEVVHAVAPGVPHRPGGLMAGKLGRDLLLRVGLRLAPSERQAVRAGVEQLAAAAEPGGAAVALSGAGR